ncbi:hypothetical protein ACLKA6_009953 [Drosophila palustris]
MQSPLEKRVLQQHQTWAQNEYKDEYEYEYPHKDYEHSSTNPSNPDAKYCIGHMCNFRKFARRRIELRE